jgi:hypothetical protein
MPDKLNQEMNVSNDFHVLAAVNLFHHWSFGSQEPAQCPTFGVDFLLSTPVVKKKVQVGQKQGRIEWKRIEEQKIMI